MKVCPAYITSLKWEQGREGQGLAMEQVRGGQGLAMGSRGQPWEAGERRSYFSHGKQGRGSHALDMGSRGEEVML